MNSTDVVELELKSKRFSLSMKKKEALAPTEPPQVCTKSKEYHIKARFQVASCWSHGLTQLISNALCAQVQYVQAPQQAPQQFAPQFDFQPQQQQPQAPQQQQMAQQQQQQPQQAEQPAAAGSAPAADGTEVAALLP